MPAMLRRALAQPVGRLRRRLSARLAEPLGFGRRASVAAVVALVAAGAAYLDWFERIDLLVYDWMLTRGRQAPSGEVVMVTIDERSLNALGAWAWPRALHAQLVRRLDEAGARAIAFDVVFAGPDDRDPAGDLLFAAAMREHAGVVLPILHERLLPNGQLVEVLPAARLAEAAATLAHVEVEEDLDGVVRRSFLKGGVATPRWPALALAAVQVVKPDVLAGLPLVRRGERDILPMAWTRDDMILIPYASPAEKFPRVSYIDVLNGSFPAGFFRDRIVLVGATATALGDMLMVPFGRPHRLMSGVELQANIADALLRGTVLRPASAAWTAAFAAFAALASALFYEATRAPWLSFAGAAGLAAFATWSALAAVGLWLPPSAAFAGLALGLAVQAWLRFRSGRAALLWHNRRAVAGLKSIADGVIATDAAGSIVFMNPAAEQMTGFLFSEAKGRPLRSILQLQDALAGEPIELDLLIKNGVSAENNTVEALLSTRDGDLRSVRGTIAGTGGAGRSGEGLVLALNDVTDVHNLARSIEYQATHDPLTSLPNRKLFEQTLEHALAAPKGQGKYATVVLIEFVYLAAVSEALGQQAANAILRMAATRLARSVRDRGMVARIGERSFALLFPGLGHGDAAPFLAQRIRKTLAEPFDIAGFEQSVSTSIGTATYPRHAGDARSLLVAAEQAIAGAKAQGIGRIQHAAEAPRSPAYRRDAIRRNLREALERGEMELHFQPQVDLALGGMTGVEALLRWWGADGRLHPPEEVVAVAKELGLAMDLAGWVLSTACREAAAAAAAAGIDRLRVSVNLTADQFLDPELPALIRNILARPGRRAVSLVLEITEETLIAEVDEARQIIQDIRDLGVDVFIDDFGVGYASLVYLKKLPLTGLKIDKSYVHDALLEANGAAIVRAIIALAHSMRIKVIAEGVESPEQLDFLRGETCDEVQGYLISRPLPPQRLVSWLQAQPGASRSSLTG